MRSLLQTPLAALVVTLVLAGHPAGAAATPRALYVADGVAGSPGELWQFSVRRPSGLPVPLPLPAVVAGEDAKHIALTANGRFAYATGGADGLVYAYRVLPGRGRLAPLWRWLAQIRYNSPPQCSQELLGLSLAYGQEQESPGPLP